MLYLILSATILSSYTSSASCFVYCSSVSLKLVLFFILITTNLDFSFLFCFAPVIPDQLLTMIEVLASHSIMAAELKQLIGALRTTEDNFLPSYYYKMLQIMCTTAHRKEGIYPLYYFDLRSPRSHINVPHLQQWPNTSGFSFHAWVRLDHTSSLQSTESEDVSVTPTKHRRVLYR